MPTLLISVPKGVWYFATVTFTADPSLRGTMVWIKPLPYVGSSPKTVARLLSRKAAVKTSEADAGAFVDDNGEFLIVNILEGFAVDFERIAHAFGVGDLNNQTFLHQLRGDI